MKVIKNGIVFTNGEFNDKIDVILNDGKIFGFAHCLDSFNGEIIDAEGSYVLPGFIDIHIHGIYGHDTMEGTEDSLLQMSKALVQYGVTSFLPTTVTASSRHIHQALASIALLSKKSTGGAAILGCHLEGPFINGSYKGAQSLEYVADCSMEYYKQMVGVLEGEVKMVTLAPEKPGSAFMVRYLKDRGITVSCGHSGASYEEFSQGVQWGITHVTHLFNGMNALHHRNPGVPGAALTHPQVAVEMIADMIHLHPGTIRFVVGVKGYEKCILVSDSMMATGMGDGSYELGAQKVFVKNGEARLAEGNLAGSTLTLNKAVRNMVEKVGVPLEKVIPMASANPAAEVGEGSRRGKIAQGYEADICLMDRQWNINKTLVKGEVCYDRKGSNLS